MVSYLARLTLIVMLVVSPTPTMILSYQQAGASVRPPGAPTPQQIRRTQDSEDDRPTASGQQKLLYFFGQVVDWFFWIGDWINRNAAAISLIFAAALVIVTRKLSSVTNAVAEAAKVSARISQSEHSPYVLPLIKTHSLIYGGGDPSPEDVNDRPRLEYCFRNYGKSPAIINRIRSHLISGPTPPDYEIGDQIALPANRVIDQNEKTREWLVHHSPRQISTSELNDLINQRTFIWFHGTIEYEDVLGTEYVTEFCWRHDARQELMAPYNKDRKRNKCYRKIPKANTEQ